MMKTEKSPQKTDLLLSKTNFQVETCHNCLIMLYKHVPFSMNPKARATATFQSTRLLWLQSRGCRFRIMPVAFVLGMSDSAKNVLSLQ